MSNKTKESKENGQIMYFRFPFISEKINKIIEKNVKQLVVKYFKDINIRMVFYNNKKTSSFIKLKESLADGMCSMIVYKFSCPKCNLEYVGSSTKCLSTRVFEHRGISQRTLTPLCKPQQSSIRDHCESKCKTVFDITDFTILQKSRFESELRLTETFYIENLKPALNIENSSSSKKVF